MNTKSTASKKQKAKPKVPEVAKNLYVADFETTTLKINEDKAEVYIAGLLNVNTKSTIILYGIEEFMQAVEQLPKGSIIYFHNLRFDGEFILHWLLENGFYNRGSSDLDNPSIKNKPKGIRNCFKILQTDTSTIYQLELFFQYKNKRTNKIRKKKITFKCSLVLLNLSVEKLAKQFEMDTKKGEIDYDKYFVGYPNIKEDKELHDYLKQDLFIVSEALKKYWMKITVEGEFKRLFGLTSSSISLKQFKSYVNLYNLDRNKYEVQNQEKLRRIFSSREMKGFRNEIDTNFNYMFNWALNGWTEEEHVRITTYGFRGGYTNGKKSIIDKWVNCKSGISYDVNSLYPSIMLNYKLPFGRRIWNSDIKNKIYGEDYYTFKDILIFKIESKDIRYPGLVKNTLSKKLREKHELTSKYIIDYESEDYKSGDFIHQIVMQDELDFWLKYYKITYKTLNTYHIATTDIFSKYIETVKREKMNATSPEDRAIAKLKQNSLYGKFGEKREKSGTEYIQTVARNIIDVEYGEGYFRREKDEYIDFYKLINPLVAVAITSLSRITLQTCIFDNIDYWLYSDTDSCYFSESENLKVEEDDIEYGKWKIEKQFTQFKWIRPKCYGLIDNEGKEHFTVSGLNKKGQQLLTKENFKAGLELEDVKLQVKRVKGGILLKPIGYKIKEELSLKLNEV